jgi:hypothetical protein
LLTIDTETESNLEKRFVSNEKRAAQRERLSGGSRYVCDQDVTVRVLVSMLILIEFLAFCLLIARV